jgi:hypothetical protein
VCDTERERERGERREERGEERGGEGRLFDSLTFGFI